MAEYYVTQAGAGTGNGSSLANAYSAAAFNALSGNYAGDFFYFSGTFTTRIVITSIYGDGTGNVTLDGLKDVETNPIASVNTNAALLTRGMDIGNRESGPDYLTIQDFRMTDGNYVRPTLWIAGVTGDGTEDERNIDYTIIRRNYIYEAGDKFMTFYRGRYNIIVDNKFYIYGRHTKDNAIQSAMSLIELDNSLFARNEVGHDGSFIPRAPTHGPELVTTHGCKELLIEYNNLYGAYRQCGLRPKEWRHAHSRNIIVRFNKVHDNHDTNSGKGIYARTNYHGGSNDKIENYYVYGNYVYDNGTYGIMVGAGMEGDLFIWSNIVPNNGRSGIIHWQSNNTALNILNNTIYGNNTLNENDISRGGIIITGGADTINIKNNLLANNRPAGERSRMQIFSNKTIHALEHNTYFHSLGSMTVYYDGGYRTLGSLKSTYNFENISPAGSEENPLFTNPNANNFTLQYDSPCRDTASDVSGSFTVNLSGGDALFQSRTGYSTITMTLAEALDPTTDWSGQPSPAKIKTTNRATVGWDRGAYSYSDVSDPPPPSGTTTTTIEHTGILDSNNAATSLSYNHPGGPMVVFMKSDTGTSTVTFNGQSLPLINTSSGLGGSDHPYSQLFFSENIAAANDTITVADDDAICVASLSACNLRNWVLQRVGGNVGSISGTVDSSENDLVLCFAAWRNNSQSITSHSNQTREIDDTSPTRMGLDSKLGGSTQTTAGFDIVPGDSSTNGANLYVLSFEPTVDVGSDGQWIFDPSTKTVGADPIFDGDFSLRGDAFDTNEIISLTHPVGDKVWDLGAVNSKKNRWLYFEPTPLTGKTVEVLILAQRNHSNYVQASPCARMNDSVDITTYLGGIRNADGSQTIRKVVNGEITNFNPSSIVEDVNGNWIFTRFRAHGTTIMLKSWKLGTTEPGYGSEVEDGDIATGGAGVHVWLNDVDFDFDTPDLKIAYFSVGYGNDPAPMPASVNLVTLSPSVHISNSAADTTTAIMTPPTGKATSDFITGRVSDDTNPLPAISLTSAQYTEIEFSVELSNTLQPGDSIQFRITDNGAALGSYGDTPSITIITEDDPVVTVSGRSNISWY